MKNIRALLFLILFLCGTAKIFATSWNEPWADKVIKEAEYFVLADILSSDAKSVKIKIIKQFGGEKLPEKISITGYYLLRLMSSSGDGETGFHLNHIKRSYFFIKKNDKGKYCIATPTTGFDLVHDGKVHATYRHSYHQALVPPDIYEMTMSAIFNHYHKLPYDKKKVTDYIDSHIAKKPAGFNESEIDAFFLQHVALELIYHLRLGGYCDKIAPFLNDKENFHNRISAARALIACDNDEAKNLLINKIATNEKDDFTTVICIWTLKEFRPKELKTRLQSLVEKASTKENGFGGNIMDPRVGTFFPSVRGALVDLIESL